MALDQSSSLQKADQIFTSFFLRLQMSVKSNFLCQPQTDWYEYTL